MDILSLVLPKNLGRCLVGVYLHSENLSETARNEGGSWHGQHNTHFARTGLPLWTSHDGGKVHSSVGLVVVALCGKTTKN